MNMNSYERRSSYSNSVRHSALKAIKQAQQMKMFVLPVDNKSAFSFPGHVTASTYLNL